MKSKSYIVVFCLLMSLPGCIGPPSERLTFPASPMVQSKDRRLYDVDGNGKSDFALLVDESGRLDLIAYDDNEDGEFDREYRLSDYDPARVPHVILMLDSIPYRAVARRYEAGDWPWFDPPAKVIPPFPTMSGVIFSDILHCPPLPGVINRHYDRRTGRINNMIVKRVFGFRNPWHLRLHYTADYWQNGLSYLKPRQWYASEMATAKGVIDASPDRVTRVYIASTSGMVSVFGEAGANEVLDTMARFCLQLIYERQGAVNISVLSDHGHTFLHGRGVDISAYLEQSGFSVGNRLQAYNDVVIDADGLVNYVGLHTRRAADVSEALLGLDEVQLVTYLQGQTVVVRNSHGTALIDHRGGAYRYKPVEGDVLGYAEVMMQLSEAGLADADGYVMPEAWLEMTADHRYPDAPYRLWQAFHGLVINTPDVLVTLREPYYATVGLSEMFIDMASIHGGLDQRNSAAFLMSTTGRSKQIMRSHDVMPAIDPKFIPPSSRD